MDGEGVNPPQLHRAAELLPLQEAGRLALGGCQEPLQCCVGVWVGVGKLILLPLPASAVIQTLIDILSSA